MGDISGGPNGSITAGTVTGGSGGDLASATVAASNMVANCIDKGSLALAIMQYQQTNLTAAQVKALNTTPIVVVTAPGAGYMVVVDSVLVTMVYNTATYSCNASGASLFYGATAAGQAVGATITQAFIQASSGTNFAYVRGSATLITDVTANLANAPVTIKAASTDPTTGDSIIKVLVYYKTIAVPLT